MRPTPSPRVTAYAGLTAIFLLAALAVRRPELAVLALPFALPLALGLRLARAPEIRVDVDVERATALEQDELAVELTVSSETPVERLELVLVVPDGLEVVSGASAQSIRLGWEDERTLELRLRCLRWGNYELGDVRLRARDRLGLTAWETRLDRRQRLRVYPLPETLRRIVRPVSTQLYTGNEVARQKGEGMEFADLRLFAPGDRVRSINWRASARRDELVVNERHPERNADVILFLDTFADARSGGRSTLDLAVRATATLAARYLERRDRVGLVSFGGVLRWLTPGMGTTQRYRIVDALLESEIVFNYAWKDVDVIPARVLPPQALDRRGDAAARRPRRRGARRPARAPVRPRDRRGLARELRRAGRERGGPARAPALGAAARRDPGALRAARRRGRELERRRAARRRAGGGEGIQAPRADRARLAAGAAAVAAAAGTGLWLAAIAEDGYLVRATLVATLAAAVLLAGGLVLRWPVAIPAAVCVLATPYVAALGFELDGLDTRAPLIAALLFVVAELAYWSLELRGTLADEPGTYLRRVALLARPRGRHDRGRDGRARGRRCDRRPRRRDRPARRGRSGRRDRAAGARRCATSG